MSVTQRKITLTQADDGWWTAREETIGLTTQGETRDEALASLDAVIAAIESDAGRAPTDEELRDAGLDPEDNRRARSAADRVGGRGLFTGEAGEAFADAVEASREEFGRDYEERHDDLFGQ